MEKDHIRNFVPYDNNEVDKGIYALREEIADATWINVPVELRQRRNKVQMDEEINASREEIVDATWINSDRATLCQKVLEKPLLIAGVFLLVVSVLGLVFSLYRAGSIIQWICMVLLSLPFLGLVCFMVCTTVTMSRAYYREIKSGDYSNWLQKYLMNEEHWKEIKSRLFNWKIWQRIPTGKYSLSY
ncbi:hypothetical protein K7X08_034757 [Anisodus acutangulus]|uniref:Uncharacterized protein n=1 Tax=Anisodus acutangulus TaxID=402998 RepID=A0A9Q1R1Q3_9SOLA|nr:hypothetical protein K7X08_034757 [Anisodus acutangulus]